MPFDNDVEAGIEAARIHTRHCDLPSLTRQELEFAASLAATSDIRVSAERCGITAQRGNIWSKRDDIQQHVAALLAPHQEALARGVSYTIADAHADLEMGKRMAANASEWFKGVELLMRLHQLGEKKTQADVNVNVNVTNRHQLSAIDDTQLIEMAGMSFADLLPQAIDAELVDDDD